MIAHLFRLGSVVPCILLGCWGFMYIHNDTYVLKFALVAVCRYNDKRNETN